MPARSELFEPEYRPIRVRYRWYYRLEDYWTSEHYYDPLRQIWIQHDRLDEIYTPVTPQPKNEG